MAQMIETEIIQRHVHGIIKQVDRTAHTIEMIVTRQEVDADSEVIITRGVSLERYERNPLILLQHNPERRIGRMDSLVLTTVQGADALVGRAALRDAEVASEVEDGVLGGVSVGFRSLERGAPILPGQTGSTHLRTELMEVSLVSLPSCASCVVIAKALGDGRAPAPAMTRGALTALIRECVVRAVDARMPQLEKHLHHTLLKLRGRVD